VYSYLIEHDLGLAPNPFGQYCTLAVCKPKIRKSKVLQIGDWVIGTGSKALEGTTGKKLTDKLIYAMKVTDRISFEEYWTDKRFQYKKPIMNGSLVGMFGDNFYRKNANGNWVQEDSAHSKQDGTCNQQHLDTDIGGNNVLISEHFFYFGDKAPIIPNNLLKICHTGIGEKKLTAELADEFLNWLSSNFQTGIHGDPLGWMSYDQLNLF
jgi:hypothetical protein